jgi:hypothetical protein
MNIEVLTFYDRIRNTASLKKSFEYRTVSKFVGTVTQCHTSRDNTGKSSWLPGIHPLALKQKASLKILGFFQFSPILP